MRNLLLRSLPCLLLAGLAFAETPEGISEEAAKARAGRLMSVVESWEKDTGIHVVYDTAAFWKKLGPKATFNSLAQYIKLEDGVKEPLRTGREVELYNRIKGFCAARKDGDTLGMDRLLQLGLESAEPANSTVILQEVVLTLHNVVRLLARPQQWAGPGHVDDFGHPESDPAFPILEDLRGRKATKDRTMADMFDIKRKPDGALRDDQWPYYTLFHLTTGVFQPQPGAIDALWNGGCHYYFWVGALARTVLGPAAVVGGLVAELKAKEATGSAEQGVVQVTHFTAGSMFGSDAFAKRDGLLSGFDGRWTGKVKMLWDGKPVETEAAFDIRAAEKGFLSDTLDPKTMKPMPMKGSKDNALELKKEGEGDDLKQWVESRYGGAVLKFHLEGPGVLRVEGYADAKPDEKMTGELRRAPVVR